LAAQTSSAPADAVANAKEIVTMMINPRWIAGAVLVAVLGTFPASGFAYQPTPAQKSACMGDTLRLCSSEIPNVDRIVKCMTRQKSSISNPRCRAYFDNAGL